MYIDALTISDEYKNYASPRNKVSRMNRSGDLIRIRRGLYLKKNDPDISLRILANIIYGPSYISYKYAMSYHGLIPEQVKSITSAVFRKNKTKTFRTPLSEFRYYLIPVDAYPYGVMRLPEGQSFFLIASPEKALCDTIIKVRPVGSRKDFEILLHENLRIEREDVLNLDAGAIGFLAPLYRRTNVNQLKSYRKKR